MQVNGTKEKRSKILAFHCHGYVSIPTHSTSLTGVSVGETEFKFNSKVELEASTHTHTTRLGIDYQVILHQHDQSFSEKSCTRFVEKQWATFVHLSGGKRDWLVKSQTLCLRVCGQMYEYTSYYHHHYHFKIKNKKLSKHLQYLFQPNGLFLSALIFRTMYPIRQGFPTCGPRATCGPRGNTVRPAKSYTF